jgi:hypothetical protein
LPKQDLELLEYNDILVGINSLFEQYGVREVLKDFRDAYPKMFDELHTQINRFPPKTAALLR